MVNTDIGIVQEAIFSLPNIYRRMKTQYNRIHPPGFALVVTLTLMVLLSILAVGMLSLSVIEIRRTTSGDTLSKAQNNARLALKMALNELQMQMGPDRRISAPGGQALPGSSKSASANWTGVYDSWTEDAGSALVEERPTPNFRRWLISGDEGVVSTEDSAKTATRPSATTVALTTANAASDAVEAGLIPTPNGAYAWWVADQNTKAKLSGVKSNPGNGIEAIARLQATPRSNHSVFLGQGSDSNPQVEKMVTISSTDFLGGDGSDELIHDATTESSGLLTNVRNGGLRKDLSFLLERPWAEANSGNLLPALYTAGGEEGINLRELWLYYNLWGEIKQGPPNHADGGSFPASTPYLLQSANSAAAAADIFYNYTFLTKLETRFVYSLISEKQTDSAGNETYKLFLVFDPIATFWNPFNITYNIPRSGYNAIKFWGMPYTLNLKIGDNEINPQLDEIINNGDLTNLQIGRSQNLVMRPGEVQVISQGPNSVLKEKANARVVNGKLGWDNVSGFKFPIPIPNNIPKPKATDKLTYSITANKKVTDFNITHVNHTVGEGTPEGAATTEYVGVFAVSKSGDSGGEVNATQLDWVFPGLPALESYSRLVSDIEVSAGSDLSARKWPLVVLSHGVRTEFDSNFKGGPQGYTGIRHTSKPFLRMNPKVRNYNVGEGQRETIAMMPTQIGIRRPGGGGGAPVDVTGTGLGYYGGDLSAKYGTSYIVTHSIPFAPIFSLGALQNSIANGQTNFGAKGRGMLHPAISHPIANSFAPSYLEQDELRGQVGRYEVADHSYLANLALWDDYFFSSISPVTTTSNNNESGALAEQKAAFKAFADPSVGNREPLPNPRMRPFVDSYQEAEKSLFPDSAPAPGNEPYRLSASMLMIDGAFNVNSVSVKAWTSFLMGLKNSEVPTLDPLSPSRPTTLTTDTDTPIAGLLGAAGGKIDEKQAGNPLEASQWLGFRSLTDLQIEELAEETVNKVRQYGPFLSLADFINRRPEGSTDEALVGPLQAAIDATDINEPYKSAERTTTEAGADFAFPEAENGSKSIGIPGYVKQGDLLTTMAPLLAVRGDTFLIRAYGEAHDSDGNVSARAWCEATVQRTPDYLDPADENHIATKDLTSPANKTMGRRFEIVSFRYLSPSEIL